MRTLLKPIMGVANLYLRAILKYEYKHQQSVPFNERAMEYQFVFKQITKYCPGHILDVGTGQTALPALIRQCGVRVTAVDNIKDFWPKGMSNRHYYVINDDITATNLRSRFDMISCISVLEHIKDYNAAIDSMFSLLNSGSYLMLTFPYNEKGYIRNVYELDGSNAPADLPYITQAFSRNEIYQWATENGASIVDQQYWRYFTGHYWSVGKRLPYPEKVDDSAQAQVAAILMRKNRLQKESM